MAFCGFFERKERVFSKKNYSAWKEAKKALKAAGIRYSAGYYETEMPVGGCGAKLDIRDFGANGKIERQVYYIDVPVKDVPRAKALPEIDPVMETK